LRQIAAIKGDTPVRNHVCRNAPSSKLFDATPSTTRADGFGRLSQRDVTRQPNTPVLLKAFRQAAPPEMHDI
jgi:hypothetical protein